VSLPASAGNANYQTAFIGVSNMGNGVKIDELSVHAAPTCARPTGLTVTAVTNSTADISWNNSAPSYEVRYRIEGSWSWHRTVVHTNSVTLTDLQNLSNYQVCVRALCSAYDRSEWCDNASFVTNACIYPIVHYNYDPATAVPALSNYAPSDGYYPYTYSEVIVDASTLAGLDNIIAIGFNPTNTDVGSHYGNADIYIGSTTDTVLNNFKFDSSFVHVFHGSLNYASTGWKYFRLGPQGHNLVTIEGETANVGGFATLNFCRCWKRDAICHLSAIHPSASSAKRTGSLAEDGKSYVIHDAFSGVKPGTVLVWRMNTYAKPKIDGRAVVLEKNGKRLRLEATKGEWSTFVPELPKSNPDPNLVQLQLRVAADESGDAAWSVTFIPL
jgi:hypothetical protein